jgi:hypothetical protein
MGIDSIVFKWAPIRLIIVMVANPSKIAKIGGDHLMATSVVITMMVESHEGSPTSA